MTIHPDSIKKEALILLGLAVLAFIFRWPAFDYPWDNDSGAIAYSARLILAGEPLYSTHHPGHHLPAAYYIYSLAFMLFGDSEWAVKFFLILWTIPAAYLVYRLGVTLTSRSAGFLGAAWFLLLTSEMWLKGLTTEIELFANLSRIATVWLLIILLKREAHGRPFIWVGLLGTICFWFKAVYFASLGVAGIALCLRFWRERNLKNFISDIFWLSLGSLIALIVPLLYFSYLGLWPRLWQAFVFGSYHTSSGLGLAFIVLYPLLGLSLANAPFLIVGVAGALLLLVNKNLSWPERFIIPMWLALTLIEAGFSRKPWPNYYLLLVPPLALSAAWFVTRLFHTGKNLPQPGLRGSVVALATLLFLAIPAATLWLNFAFYQHYVYYHLGQETYQESIIRSRPDHGYNLIAIQETADYIQAHSLPAAHIYLWGDFPQLYYLANRRSALDTIWNIYTDIPYLPGGVEEARQKVLASTTFYIVVMDPLPNWLARGLAEHYAPVKTFNTITVYERIN